MQKSYDEFIKLSIRHRLKGVSDFSRLKKEICKKLKMQPPTNADLRENYEKMVAKKEISRDPAFEKMLLAKKIRTESGVAVVAVLTKPSDCPGNCLFCPTEKDMPKSYLSNEPAVMRAISNQFNPYLQVQSRLKALELNGHSTEKIELIVMGGTFSYFPKTYQKKFITECFRACNDYPKSASQNRQPITQDTLSREQKKNEKAKCRIVGLTLETRPDYIDEEEILNFRSLGCTRVELGVQSIFDEVLEINRRGHLIDKTIEATKLLKDAGFKINYHMMPGLFGSSIKKDYLMFQELFKNQSFQPDMLKIYPTVVTKNSALYSIWKKGGYKALNDKQFEKLIIRIKNEIIPPYVRIQRLVRDVPLPSIEAGPVVSNLRQIIEKKSHCRCIRCREVRGEYDQTEDIVLDRIDYDASDGKEIFLQFVSRDKQKLFSMLRLRIPKDGNANHFIPALKNAALIREVHTYGKLAGINKKDKNSPQHIGLGRKLLKEAEQIVENEFGLHKIAVISGIGVRNYYRKNGYRLKDSYMVKAF